MLFIIFGKNTVANTDSQCRSLLHREYVLFIVTAKQFKQQNQISKHYESYSGKHEYYLLRPVCWADGQTDILLLLF